MASIKQLSEELINKIAAGEVVDRPASVVKELIENSIDADATKIKIEVEEAGTTLIKVIDNGKGMSEKDIKLCFLRHATSKIITEEDLFSIGTLGFRGEALASIAAVSDMIISSKQKDEVEGNQITLIGGKLTENKKVGVNVGTTISVKNLFYNTPARKKYMKAKSTEISHIIDIATRYALNYPTFYFELIHNGRKILLSPSSDELSNIVSVYGKDIAKDLIRIDSLSGDISVKGFISKPKLTKLSRDFQSIFVNGRYVKNKIITDAVYEGYGNLLFHDRNPVFVLDIEISLKDVDVNVHPSKIEIKLSHEDVIMYAVKKAVEIALEKNDLVPEIRNEEVQEVFAKVEKNRVKRPSRNYNLDIETQSELCCDTKNKYEESFKKFESKVKEVKEDKFKIHGQVDFTYILVEDDEGLMIVDQHAAEERVNFEKFMNQYKDKAVNKQQLLEPIMLEVSSKEANIINSNIGNLSSLGYDVEDFGENAFVVRTSPNVLNKQQGKEMLFDLIKEAEISNNPITNLTYDKIASKSCRASVKAGDAMSYTLMKELVSSLKKCEVPYTCPHGRPTMIRFTIRELEKMFKRVF